jgi:hypothetical protein
MCLQFAEGLLDRIEIRRIRRKIKQRRARRFDRLPYTGGLGNISSDRFLPKATSSIGIGCDITTSHQGANRSMSSQLAGTPQ